MFHKSDAAWQMQESSRKNHAATTGTTATTTVAAAIAAAPLDYDLLPSTLLGLVLSARGPKLSPVAHPNDGGRERFKVRSSVRWAFGSNGSDLSNTEAFGYNQARLEISTLKLSGARRHGMLAPATVPGRWWCSLNAGGKFGTLKASLSAGRLLLWGTSSDYHDKGVALHHVEVSRKASLHAKTSHLRRPQRSWESAGLVNSCLFCRGSASSSGLI